MVLLLLAACAGERGDAADGYVGGGDPCNRVDDDGDGDIDEGSRDHDRDGILDCFDAEECDGLDNDGDGSVDEGFDADGDGVGACLDCDDANPDAEYAAFWHADEDGDGFGDPDVAVYDCAPPDAVANAGDCDDTEPSVNPAAPEVCGNDRDDNCDGISCPPMTDYALEYFPEIAGDYGDESNTGYELATGDLDGDGLLELVVAASAGVGERIVYVVAAPVTGGERFPDAAAAELRFNASQYAELAAGEGRLVVGADHVWVFEGLPGAGWNGHEAVAVVERAAKDLALTDDVDGDGVGELLIGVSSGLALVENDVRGHLLDADVPTVEGGVGHRVAAPGDVDGDGLDDVLLADRDAGRAWMLLGPVSISQLADADAWFDVPGRDDEMTAVNDVGDLDGDGRADIAVTAQVDDACDSRDDAVFVFSTPPVGAGALEEADHRVCYLSQRMTFGLTAVEADLDWDGYDDLVAGAPTDYGGAVVWEPGPLARGTILADTGSWFGDWGSYTDTWDTRFTYGAAGAGLARLSDTDGSDGLAIGQPGPAWVGDPGRVFILEGEPGF